MVLRRGHKGKSLQLQVGSPELLFAGSEYVRSSMLVVSHLIPASASAEVPFMENA